MDRDILRKLAGQVMEIAALPVQKENEKLYRALNALKPIRPVVLLDELPWNQLNAGGELSLECEDPFFQEVELGLRKTLYQWKHCPGDMIVQPFYRLGRSLIGGDIGIEVDEEILISDGENNIVSHHYRDVLSTWEALEKLHAPTITVDEAETDARFEALDAVFGDLMPIKLIDGNWMCHFNPWDDLSRWRGVEPILTDLVERPEFLHATMRKLTDIHSEMLNQFEAFGIFDPESPYIHCTAALTDGLERPASGARATRRNMWGRGTAQLFAVVSPAMHEEFDLQYQREYFKDFGLLYYGCCEPLHNKIDELRAFSNLRKISITPWANVHEAAERIGGDYVLARKPNPASVAVSALDEAELRRDILETLTVCRANDTPVEFTLKDISSADYRPENLERWEKIVMETVKNF